MGDALSFDSALQRILKAATPRPIEAVSFDAAANRVLAEPILAGRDDPSQPKSSMDGFAVRSQDTARATPSSPVRFSFTQVIAAGQVPTTGLPPSPSGPSDPARGFPAMRIMTGGLLPAGADAVIKQEDTVAAGTGGFFVRHSLARGENVVPRGARMERGELLLPAGEIIGPQALGILAAAHQASTPVFRRPVVAVLALGDELVGPTEPLGPGSIPVTNLYVIAELARRYGGDVHNLGIAPDNSQCILELLQPCCTAEQAQAPGSLPCDLVITLGGTHRGDFDFVHSVLEGLGARLEFDRVAMTPGASTVFATRGPLLIFGLPGTPAASWVAFESLVRPALLSLAGRSRWLPHRVRARVSEPLNAGRGRTLFVPCRLEWRGDEWSAYPIHGRYTREAPASLRADGLIRLDDQNPECTPGSWVTVDWIAD